MLSNHKNILITGGAGFIGKHLVNALLQKECKITIVDRAIGYSSDSIEYCCSDIAEYLRDSKKIEKFDVVFHLAGNSHPLPSVNDPLMDFNLNLQLSMLLLEALRKTEKKIKLINISSAAIYGSPEKLPIEEFDKAAPLSPYGVSKLAVENYVTVYSKLYNIKGISVRPFSVFGPGLHKQVIYDLFIKLLKNPDKLEVFGDGSQLRDFIFIEDLINALILVAEKGTPGDTYNIATGKSYSINDVIKSICTEMDIHPEILYTGAVRSGEPEKWIVDISKIQKLGFLASVDLQLGIKKTFNWIRSL